MRAGRLRRSLERVSVSWVRLVREAAGVDAARGVKPLPRAHRMFQAREERS
jgi:hypothetical protein